MSAEAARLRAGIVTAIEAIEDGDHGYALDVLRALDETPTRTVGCPFCSLRFEWPGLVDHHVLFSHGEEMLSVAA